MIKIKLDNITLKQWNQYKGIKFKTNNQSDQKN